jgi:hypothetical protein
MSAMTGRKQEVIGGVRQSRILQARGVPSYRADLASNGSEGDKGKRYAVTGLLSCLPFPSSQFTKGDIGVEMKKTVRVIPPIDYMEERRMAGTLKPNSRRNGKDKKTIRHTLKPR